MFRLDRCNFINTILPIISIQPISVYTIRINYFVYNNFSITNLYLLIFKSYYSRNPYFIFMIKDNDIPRLVRIKLVIQMINKIQLSIFNRWLHTITTNPIWFCYEKIEEKTTQKKMYTLLNFFENKHRNSQKNTTINILSLFKMNISFKYRFF